MITDLDQEKDSFDDERRETCRRMMCAKARLAVKTAKRTQIFDEFRRYTAT